MKFLNLLLLAVLALTACGYVGETPTLTSVRGGNVKLAANSVTSENVNGNILLDPNGSGSVNLPDLTASLPLKLDASKNISSAAISLAGTEVTGTLTADKGGTGAASLTLNNVLLGNGTSAVQFVAPGSSGNVLTSNGTTWSSAAPSGGTVTGPGTTVDSEIVLFNGTTGNVLKRATGTGVAHVTSGVLSASNVLLGSEVTGTLPIANAGTNSVTALSGSSIMISNGSAIVQGAAGTTTTVLHGNAAGAPTYGAVSLTADVSGITPILNGGTGATTLAGANIVTNAGTSTDNHLATFDSTTGKIIQDSSVAVLSDAGILSGLTQLDVDNMRLASNTFSSTNANGDIAIIPNGTGNVNITPAVSIGTAVDPVASAMLEVSSTSKGFLPPKMTAAQRDAISSPATGLMVYNTDSNEINYYNGSSWSSTRDSATMMTQLAGESYFAGTTSATCTRASSTIGALTCNAALPGPTTITANVGSWQTTDANLLQQTINSLPAGQYKATFVFEANINAGSAFAINAVGGSALTPVTCQSVPGIATAENVQLTITCNFSNPTSQNVDFELFAGNASGTLTVQNTRSAAPATGTRFYLEYTSQIRATASVSVSATETFTDNADSLFSSCTNAAPSVCTFTTPYAVAPYCWSQGAGSYVSASTTTTTTVERTDAATAFKIGCNGTH